MQKITWFKDNSGHVYIWRGEVIPYPTTVDSADFCFKSGDPTFKVVIPDVVQAADFDWGFATIPLVKRVGDAA